MSVCQVCSNAESNGGKCSEVLSSNGSTTWYTPCFPDIWELPGVGDGHLFVPQTKDECNGFQQVVEGKNNEI